MSHELILGRRVPAPCIVDTGMLVDKRDMHRLLGDLGRVRYVFFQDGGAAGAGAGMVSQGEGAVVEVFCEGFSATMVSNGSLYLNVMSFDGLKLGRSSEGSFFDLMMDDRILRLIPVTETLGSQRVSGLDRAALDAVVADVLAGGWENGIEDDDDF
jgi:hypothetical protein